ncbi:PTS fructose-like transporter subunit IIB [Pigmentiphaga aceris]|uniref:protein-N(pi)-phosphohistidine--D-fructose phosphotransferase n=1 Tax=Pigmentiphaga aceris TaxID=1940612 RepID=A0A5C0B0B6_9BURK|nr:PTS fructose-like transporter subunit IIB [Pigmentiphaga aceris]QEI06067.1 PTS fructose-like transporter subunit IIB [Pigmentiphaga aceris]
MHVVIITSCPNGKVTSILSARLLAAAATRLGWRADVETHGSGQGNGLLSDAQIADADLVVAVHTGALPLTRFQGKRVHRATPAEALADPAAFLQNADRDAKVWQEEASASTGAPATPAASAVAPRIVAVTACPTGVAHTFMAAEALQHTAGQMGVDISVETQGSVGARNVLDAATIAAADIVLLATDIEVDLSRFKGKRVFRCGTSVALKQPKQTIERALLEAKVQESAGASSTSSAAASGASSEKRGVYKHLLTGVSFMLPMVVAGGLLIALSFVFGIEAFKEAGTLPAALMQIGGDTAFKLMVPMLAGYIAYSIADRPGLAPGMIGGMLASTLAAGFLGGIAAGFIAGYATLAITRWVRLPTSLEALKPILIIPLVASLFTGLVMIYIVGKPVAAALAGLTTFLDTMGTSNAVLLGLLLGAMMCVDLGGPINKAAYAFSVGLLASQSYSPMAAAMAGGMVPPIGMGIATLLARRKFAQSERDAGKAALVLGMCFISEAAIPFAAKDPMRVIPASLIGGGLTGALSMFFGCKLVAPHGGMFVLLIPGAITPALLYLAAIAAGSVVTGVIYAVIKKDAAAEVSPVSAPA